jgi:1-acyl-sn-glycerol-3-phosphate acyltransferase
LQAAPGIGEIVGGRCAFDLVRSGAAVQERNMSDTPHVLPPPNPGFSVRAKASRGVGSEVWRTLCGLWLRGFGWRMGDDFPDVEKAVIIAAPHTSNWDGIHMVAMAGWYRIKFSWMGKAALVKGPLGFIVRWTGCVPVDRASSRDLVTQMKDVFDGADRLFLAIAPEATRDPNPNWKSGFYHIAAGAGVPMIVAVLDYKTHVLRLFGPITPTGDYAADLKRILTCYAGAEGRTPEKFVTPSV